jgi:hypothetical protein
MGHDIGRKADHHRFAPHAGRDPHAVSQPCVVTAIEQLRRGVDECQVAGKIKVVHGLVAQILWRRRREAYADEEGPFLVFACRRIVVVAAHEIRHLGVSGQTACRGGHQRAKRLRSIDQHRLVVIRDEPHAGVIGAHPECVTLVLTDRCQPNTNAVLAIDLRRTASDGSPGQLAQIGGT